MPGAPLSSSCRTGRPLQGGEGCVQYRWAPYPPITDGACPLGSLSIGRKELGSLSSGRE